MLAIVVAFLVATGAWLKECRHAPPRNPGVPAREIVADSTRSGDNTSPGNYHKNRGKKRAGKSRRARRGKIYPSPRRPETDTIQVEY